MGKGSEEGRRVDVDVFLFGWEKDVTMEAQVFECD